jgi:hypothetical protein
MLLRVETPIVGVELKKLRTKRVPRNGAHEEPHMDTGKRVYHSTQNCRSKAGDLVAINFL